MRRLLFQDTYKLTHTPLLIPPSQALKNLDLALLGLHFMRIIRKDLTQGLKRPFLQKLVLLFVCVLVLISCGNDQDDTEKQRFLIKGNDALAKQENREALRYYTEALKIDSCYTDALNNIGIVQYENGSYGEAVRNYDAAVQCDPEFWRAYLNRANAYYELNELYRALDDLEYLERKIPDSAYVYFGLGLVKTKMRKYNQAIAAFDQAIVLDSGNAEILVNRGTVYYYKDMYAEALIDLNLAIQVNPEEANAYNALALLRADQGQYDEALKLVERALMIEPFQPYFMNNRGYIRLKLDDPLAVEDINKSIVLDPKNGWAYRNKALWYMEQGRYDQAIILLTRAEKMDDFIDLLYYYQGVCYQYLKADKEACVAWNKSIEIGEKHSLEMVKIYCK
jgi:tetratricopeptide (TPR) repeat protein